MIAALLSAGASFLLLAVTFGPLEKAFPARRGQALLRPRLFVDACFFFGQYLVFAGLAAAVLSRVQPLVTTVEMLGSLPLALQCVIVVALGDLVTYWGHRLSHQVDFLWRFHAVHHTAEHLDWLAAHREHPIDGIFTQLCMNLPAFLLGFPLEVLAPVAVFRGMWGLFIHANVRLPLGPIGWLLGDPRLHHWHHARLERTRHNFANLAPWLDFLFGTHHDPRVEAGEEGYPLGVTESWPQGYVGQLVHAFRPLGSGVDRVEAADGAHRAD